jgi:hypothetical protein
MYCGNAEPSIEDLMRDPLVRLRMKRAGIVPETMRTLLRETKLRLGLRSDAARDMHRMRTRPDKIV